MGGTYLGVKVHGAIANARAIGPVLASPADDAVEVA